MVSSHLPGNLIIIVVVCICNITIVRYYITNILWKEKKKKPCLTRNTIYILDLLISFYFLSTDCHVIKDHFKIRRLFAKRAYQNRRGHYFQKQRKYIFLPLLSVVIFKVKIYVYFPVIHDTFYSTFLWPRERSDNIVTLQVSIYFKS